MDITTFLIIAVVVIIAWILIKLFLKVTRTVFSIGCLILGALAVVGFFVLVF